MVMQSTEFRKQIVALSAKLKNAVKFQLWIFMYFICSHHKPNLLFFVPLHQPQLAQSDPNWREFLRLLSWSNSNGTRRASSQKPNHWPQQFEHRLQMAQKDQGFLILPVKKQDTLGDLRLEARVFWEVTLVARGCSSSAHSPHPAHVQVLGAPPEFKILFLAMNPLVCIYCSGSNHLKSFFFSAEGAFLHFKWLFFQHRKDT